ncbi:GntR family transcriptional regulator [Actinacidiphila yeochonensis]|uniref:GntR family transcriptional regulator n=1 Tax=Actinacidiphila yeochonensis TaxID=89050 RepID=UPI00068E5FA0|nr:GntR family transcriptional regulator [Actinacidiphila yeochonensis]
MESAEPAAAYGRLPEQAGRPADRRAPDAGPGPEAAAGPGAPSERPPARLPERLSVRDQVVDALRSALVRGELAPGNVYSAPELAGRYGVSATPVREAMQLLAREGAVEVLPNRGFRVAEYTARDVAELAEVRALLEVPVLVRLAGSRPFDHWAPLGPLAAAAADAAARGDRGVYGEADRAFHQALLGGCGNQRLLAVADEMHRRAQWPALLAAAPPRAGGLAAAAAEHFALLGALSCGDLERVERLARAHLGC